MREGREIIPLRTILQNCLNHIENLESNRSICDNYEKEFQDLKHFSETLKIHKEFACTEGEKEVNRKKNRYKDILPFNVSRVILSKYAGIPGSDYINANYIKGASGSPAYIASQGPLPNTVNDFWRMVVECEVQVIVMACNAEEAGKHKCENYWVEKEGEEKRFGMVEICLVKASTVCPDFLVRTMRLKYTNDKSVTEERTICQFHYSAWPDHGVPPLVRPLLDMVRLVRDTQASETLPVLVHCSAGCGRTGTICAIDFVWGLLRAGKLTEEFSLFNLVKDMRKQRVAMVQTKEQYILVHQAVRELFKEQLRVIESHPYENIDVNGIPLIKGFEEPLYDTIGPFKDNFDEKQDENEVEKNEFENKETTKDNCNKSDTAPPLPRKKRPNIPFSKYEKEVENLTEKNRCSVIEKEKEVSDVSPSNSLLSKPRIAKLKALFERSPTNRDRNTKHRGSQTVSRSHSLGAIRKPLFPEASDSQSDKTKSTNVSVQPIPDGGKLKVPKLSLSTTVISKPSPLIKRSKSLKTISQSQKLSAYTNLRPTSDPIRDHTTKSTVVNKLSSKGNVPQKKPETISKSTFKKSVTSQDLQNAQLPNTLSKRRRSLESLIGDEHPAITWPTTVVFTPKVLSNNVKSVSGKNSSEILSLSSKHCFKTVQGVKEFATESIKQQFQNLTIEAQKKMNTFVSGIGIRERRNSFRQAISKDDAQIVKQNRPYEYIWLDPKNKPNAESKTIQVRSHHINICENLTVRNQNGEILNPPCDQTDGFSPRKEEISPVSQNRANPDCDLAKKIEMPFNRNSVSKRAMAPRPKMPIIKQNSDVHHPKLSQRPYELVRTLSSHAIQDKNSAFSVVRSNDRSRNITESKNLFLQRLNIEMQEGRNLRKPTCSEDGLSSEVGFAPLRRRSMEHSGSCESLIAHGAKFGEKSLEASLTGFQWKESNKALLNTEECRGADMTWMYNRPYTTSTDKTIKTTATRIRPNPNILVAHSSGKSNDTRKFYDHITKTPEDIQHPSDIQRKMVHKKPGLGGKCGNAQSSGTDHSSDRCACDRTINDSYADLDTKMHHSWKPGSESQIEVKSVRSTNSQHNDCYTHFPVNVKSGDYNKILVQSVNNRMPQIVEMRKRNFVSGTNSVSSHSSGDMSHSDQHSQASDSPRIVESHEGEGVTKPEVIRLKMKDKKSWTDDGSRHGSESSSSSSVRELASVLPAKPPEEVYNYGIVASVKLRSNKPSHSRDDFILGEPVAPPRVKRHTSVKLPRQTSNESNVSHLSPWPTPDKRKQQFDSDNWDSALGVDLDAVAASMQRQKGEVSSETSQSGKLYNAPTTQFSFKKQQHYL